MPFSSKKELLLIIDILRFGNDLAISADKLANIDWNYLLELTFRHRVSEQVYIALKTVPETPSEIIEKLRATVTKIKLQLLQMTAEMIKVTRTLDSLKINYIIVKGIPLAVDIYGFADCRQCKDIDLWVDKTDIEICRKILLESSYKQTSPVYELKGFKRQYYFNNKHDIIFWNSKKNTEIELHFRLEYFGINFWSINDVATKEVIVSGNVITTLANDYNFVYLVIHAATHAWSRLRWLHDIYLFLKSRQCNLVNILQLAKSLKVQHIVYQALWLVRDIYQFSNDEINSLLENKNNRAIHLAKTAIQFINADYELTGGEGIYSIMFIKYRFYLFKLAVTGQKLSTIKGDLFKIEKMFPYITLPRRLSFLYYLLYPLWLIKYIVTRKY